MKIKINVNLDYAYEKDGEEYQHEEVDIVEAVTDAVEKAGYTNEWTDSEGQPGCYYHITIDVAAVDEREIIFPEWVDGYKFIAEE